MLAWMLLGKVSAACPADLVNAEAVSSGKPVTTEPELAGNSARPGKLIGASCTYTTSLVAQRVIAEGVPWSYEGPLRLAEARVESQIACPYITGDGGFQVVATELLDILVSCGYASSPLILEGRTLEVDGVRYVVLTSFQLAPAR
jgi:hypothetical protein